MPLPKLFTPIELGGITLPNRVVVAPMCQYSADDGCMSDWHHVHLGTFACSGAGLFVVEKTGVTREGRITHGCTGIYSDHNEQAMARAVQVYRSITKNPIGIQLGHAGRKASVGFPWQGGKPLAAHESPWPTVGPSPIAYGEGWPTPHEFSKQELKALLDAYVSATQRAKRIGFDLVELHSAHGYLLHQFVSPLCNQRKDEYGRDRMKFPLEVAAAVRETWPKDRALGARINATDWVEGGFQPEDAVAYAKALKRVGLDFVCVSSGATVPHAKIPVPDASEVRCLDAACESAMKAAIDEAKKEGNTLGGIFEIVVQGLPVGLGDHTQWDRKLDGRIAQGMMSIQAIKGVEIGLGFRAARLGGRDVHDAIEYDAAAAGGRDPAAAFRRPTNGAGGLEGGITNGAPLVVRAAMKPISTLMKPLMSVDLQTGEPYKADIERSDFCALPAASVVGENFLAFVLAQALCEKFGGDSLREMKANHAAYLEHLNRPRGGGKPQGGASDASE